MSLRRRLRRLDARVRWLETEGMLCHIEAKIKLFEMKREISDRLHADPALAERWKRDFPDFPCRLPPPSVAAPLPAAREEPALREGAVPQGEAPPHAEERREAVRLEGCERPPPGEPTLREAAVPGALQSEVVPVDQPEPRPPPDMQIRPVFWRPRGEYREGDDEDDITSGTLGRCLTEYDPLAGEDDDGDE